MVQGNKPRSVISYQRQKPAPRMSMNRCLQRKIEKCGRLDREETAMEGLSRTFVMFLLESTESHMD